MEDTFTPVPYVFREVIEEEIARQSSCKVFYFDGNHTVACIEGKIIRMEEITGKGIFIFLHPEASVRIDKIITLFGKPGAAFDAYDAFGNACLDCTGDYDL
jgi:hypothetical protein